MKRRAFILGAVAAAVSAALPAKAVLLHDAAHHDISGGFGLAPIKREGASIAYDQVGERYARALARSMTQTKERVAANVLNNVFQEYEYRTFHTGTLDEVISGEGARRSVGVEGSPDRI